MQPDQDPRIAAVEGELCALPEMSPPPELWRRIEDRLARAERMQQRAERSEPPKRLATMRYAVAAAVCLTVLAALVLAVHQSGPGTEPHKATTAQSQVGNESVSPHIVTQRGEFMPRAANINIRRVPQGFAPRMVALRIADLDARLETLTLRDGVEQHRLERLQSQRNQLMDSLYHIEQSDRAARILRVAH